MTQQTSTTRTASAAAMRLEPQPGEVINRSRTVHFTWNGSRRTGFEGDTIVSTLAADGERVFSRSFKYHRPRGLLTAGFHDPGCIVQVDDEPNVRGAHRPVRDGMQVVSQNVWPSLKYDAKSANQLIGRFLPPGFYYKTFMRPARLWPAYQQVLKRFANGGVVAAEATGEYYDKRYAHPDVLVAGGGPAGMSAALAAAAAGARVMLVEEEFELGGHLRWGDDTDRAVMTDLRSRVTAAEGIEVLTNSVVLARYDENWMAVVQRGLPGVPERLIKARARVLVPAAGLIERPYVFDGNDKPGVMLSTAVRRLINLYGVKPGERAVVFTANGAGDAALADLRRAGVEIAHVADARRGGNIARALGRGAVQSVELPGKRRIDADLLVTATGWTAPTSLLNMAGDRPVYSERAARFLPGGQAGDSVLPVGGLAGDGTVEEYLAHADAVGARAAHRALAERNRHAAATPTSVRRREGASDTEPPADEDSDRLDTPGLSVDPHPALFRASTHGMVDYSEDVTSEDLFTAVQEGYDSAELAKRYTTATMGPLQGKLETINAIAVVAEATGKTIAQTGTTTWRPVYAPVTLGALAGRTFEPVRHSPMQRWHEGRGAKPLIAGQWIRPEHYGDPQAEVHAVRGGVGIIDVTPIGKLDLKGKDVPQLLNLLYVNKWSKLAVGRVRYGVMCAEDGVVFDDGVTGRLGEDHYLMSTTSSGAGAVWEWLELWLQTERPHWDVHVTPVTTAYASINVAGPRSRELVSRLTEGVDLSPEAFGYMHVRTGRVAGVDDCVLWRIGFTGELSYELHVPSSYGLHVWEALMKHGADLGVAPFGIEAQRVLRLEKGHLIVGQDTDGLTKAYSAGLDWAIKLDKDDFIGKPELQWQAQSEGGPRLVGVQPVDGSVVPPEASQIISRTGAILGRITSSRMSPTLGRSIGLAQVDSSVAASGSLLTVRLPDGSDCQVRVTEQLAHVDPEGKRQEIGVAPSSTSGAASVDFADFTDPVARPPVETTGSTSRRGHWLVTDRASSADLTLTDLSPLAKVGVRAADDGALASSLGVQVGRASRREGALVAGAGPGEWLIIDAVDGQADLAARWRNRVDETGESAAVVDQTHGRALLRLTGARAVDVLAKICAIDLADDLVPDGSALRSSVARLVTDIIRDDVSDEPGQRSYLLHCERSSGQYLFDSVVDAGAEFGIETKGGALDIG